MINRTLHWLSHLPHFPPFNDRGYPNIQEIYNEGLSRLQNVKTKQRLYIERRLTTTWMMELPRFEKHFKKYRFEWMMRAPDKYSDMPAREFYAAYKGELKI